jgi:peroxiredoxin
MLERRIRPMIKSAAKRISDRCLGLGLSFLTVLTATAVLAQESSREGDGPVNREMKEYRAESQKKLPPALTKVFGESTALVKKSGVVERALKVGDKAPDFELPDASGKKAKLSDLLKKGPVIVTWYRGGWCPYCNIYLRGFQKVSSKIKDEGATLVAISPETPKHTAETVKKDDLGFLVLSDKGNKAAHAFRIAYKIPQILAEATKGKLDLKEYNGDDSNELPLAATYLIDRDGRIRYAFIDADPGKRAEPSAVVTALRGLKKAR